MSLATLARVSRSWWLPGGEGALTEGLAASLRVVVVSGTFFTTSVWPNSFPQHKWIQMKWLTQARLT